jgi:type IV pilus assembly protein PilE
MLVLNLVFMVAALAGAMLQFGSLAASGALAAVEHVRAFHAADAVMALCERRLLAARSRGHEVPEGPLSVFGRDARWPGSIRLPECAIERLASSRTRTGGYRITARGFGSTGDAQSWAQMDLEFAPGMLHRNWRPLARRPVPDPWRGMGGGMGGGKGAGMGEGTGVLDLQGRAQSGGLRQSTPGRMRIRDRPLRTRRFARSGRPARHTTRGAAGLSLIEAMIALAVAAIIAGYAMPTYRQHLARAHRLSAALAVRQAAQYIEGRRLFDHAGGAVHGAGPRTRGSYDDRWFSLPAHLARAPADGPVVYRLRVDAGKAPGMTAGTPALSMTTRSTTPLSTTAYWIVAVPVESGPMAGDACGSFILDASGRRSNTGTAGAEQCWSGI